MASTPATSTLAAFDAALTKAVVAASRPDANVFISTYSVAAALELVWAGADATLRAEIDKQLRLSALGSDYASIVKALGEQRAALEKSDPSVSMLVAMGAFLRGDVPPAIAARLSADLDAELAPLTTAAAINQWCALKTKGEIKQIVGQLEPSTVAVLLNAIHFKGAWATPFSKAETVMNAQFTTAAGQRVHCAMMSRSHASLPVASGEAGELVRLDYGKDGAFSMLLSLPRASVDAALEELVAKWPTLAFATSDHVNLRLPRFELEHSLSLVAQLQSLGLGTMFQAGHLDAFSSDSLVSDVIHKATCRVDEAGTVAAAVSAVLLRDSLSLDELSLVFDRPFAFIIVHHATSTLLFAGRVCDPVVGHK